MAMFNSPMRPFLLGVGTVLWGLVAVGMFTVWKAQTRLDEQEQQAAATSTGSATADADGESEGIQVTLHPGTDEETTVSANGKPAPAWNPEGIEDFELTERSGQTITKQDLLGRPWVIGFIFTNCAGPCPQVTTQMKILHDQFRETDVQFVTLTVDPNNDTPERLQKYATAFGADPQRWLFLTGDRDDVYHLITESFKMPVQEVTGPERRPGWEVLHTTNLLLVDAEGRVEGKYNSFNSDELTALRRKLRKLPKVEKSQQTTDQEETAGETEAEAEEGN